MPSALSAPFASRELNGETLLDELASLRQAAMPQKHLNDCAVAARALRTTPLAEVPFAFQALARERFQAQPEIAGMLVRWAAKVKSEADLEALCLHLQRMALASGLLNAMYRGSGRLPRSGR